MKTRPDRRRLHAARRYIRGYCDTHGLSPAWLLDHDRDPFLTAHRWRLWADLLDAGMPSTQVGWLFDRDHTTVLHATRRLRQKAAA